jgi:hypothetical protein
MRRAHFLMLTVQSCGHLVAVVYGSVLRTNVCMVHLQIGHPMMTGPL